jgi:hypothetical protein
VVGRRTLNPEERARVEQALRAVTAGKVPEASSGGGERPRKRRRGPLVAAVIGAVILAGVSAVLIGRGNGNSASPAVEGTNINAPGGVSADPATPSAGAGTGGTPVSPSASPAEQPSVSPSVSDTPQDSGPSRAPTPSKTTTTVSRPAPKTVSGTRVLNRGDSIVNGPTTLKLDSGGNLVVSYAGAKKWSSGTTGKGVRGVFQADGNFVVYAADNSTVWSSRTDGHDGAVLVIGGDGNVCVTYRSTVLWQTGTAS